MDEDGPLGIDCKLVDAGWVCRVSIGDAQESYEYEVSVSRAELDRYSRGQFDPTRLIAESFRFLLEREGPDSILRSFAVSDIERFFPEFGPEIARRTGGR